MPDERAAQASADRLRNRLGAHNTRGGGQAASQGVSTPTIFAAAHGIMGREFMRGLLASQREATEGGGHHERFDRPFVSPPIDTPGQIMTLIDGVSTF